ncbi:MAG: alpha/beta fold hydrolase [Gloeomargarita sp. SKYB31]|nr:alpha/beta fold hydrolase [Gloeomargarita sp. SKYB31]
MKPSRAIYIHGFGSSPRSGKAQYLQKQLAQVGIPIAVPDLNQGDFTHLTLTRQIQRVAEVLTPEPTVLIGSSFGGLTAVFVAEQHLQVSHLVLLAPAFRMAEYWLQRLTPEQLEQWRTQGTIPVYHYGEGKELPLHYGFLPDLQTYDESHLQRPVPTLIVHGRQDDVVPLAVSEDYARTRAWVTLVPVDDDHTLHRSLDLIWQQMVTFLGL